MRGPHNFLINFRLWVAPAPLFTASSLSALTLDNFLGYSCPFSNELPVR